MYLLIEDHVKDETVIMFILFCMYCPEWCLNKHELYYYVAYFLSGNFFFLVDEIYSRTSMAQTPLDS